jgi:hypothetical protein
MTNTDLTPDATALGLTGHSPIRIVTRWREQYARMKRWHQRISEATSMDSRAVDDVYAFFVCSYHLKDWIKNDDSLDMSIRNGVEGVISQSVPLSLAGDITNGFKHLKRDRRPRVSADASVQSIGTPLGGFGLGDASLGGTVVVFDGTRVLDARGVADGCVAAWNAFLKDKGLVYTSVDLSDDLPDTVDPRGAKGK